MTLLQAISAASLLVLVPSGVSSAGEMLRLRHDGGALVIAQAMPGEHGTKESGSSEMPQQMPGGTMGGGAGGPMMGMMGRGGMMSMMMGDHIEGRIAFLKAELKITDVQMPQWNAFADTLRANVQRMREMRTTMMQGGMMSQGGAAISAPDRLDRMEKMMMAMTETLRTTKASLTALYVVLTDDQKKTADQLIHGPMGMGPM